MGWAAVRRGCLGPVAVVAPRPATVRSPRPAPATASTPLHHAADVAFAGAKWGSDLGVIAPDVFHGTADVKSPPAGDLSGLWRTADVTPCPPASNVAVRVSRFEASDGSLRAIKVAGDSCLDNA